MSVVPFVLRHAGRIGLQLVQQALKAPQAAQLLPVRPQPLPADQLIVALLQHAACDGAWQNSHAARIDC